MGKNGSKKGRTFWTVCSYCYYMYEYENKYEECRLLCQNCRKGFHAVAVAAPPEGFLVRGKDGKYHSGYGFFQLPYLGYSFLGDNKEVGQGNAGKKRDVVEISDDSDDDDERKKMHVKNETLPRNQESEVEVEGLNDGERRGVIKRVKSVPRSTKKMAGRGVKGEKVEKVNVESGKRVAGGYCVSDGGIRLGSGTESGENGVKDDKSEFIEEEEEEDDDIFLGLKDIC
ncbi:hypothetical protein PTKIN_Ptkin08bG0136600 [Pterospermum kingtungense]